MKRFCVKAPHPIIYVQLWASARNNPEKGGEGEHFEVLTTAGLFYRLIVKMFKLNVFPWLPANRQNGVLTNDILNSSLLRLPYNTDVTKHSWRFLLHPHHLCLLVEFLKRFLVKLGLSFWLYHFLKSIQKRNIKYKSKFTVNVQFWSHVMLQVEWYRLIERHFPDLFS